MKHHLLPALATLTALAAGSAATPALAADTHPATQAKTALAKPATIGSCFSFREKGSPAYANSVVVLERLTPGTTRWDMVDTSDTGGGGCARFTVAKPGVYRTYAAPTTFTPTALIIWLGYSGWTWHTTNNHSITINPTDAGTTRWLPHTYLHIWGVVGGPWRTNSDQPANGPSTVAPSPRTSNQTARLVGSSPR